MNPLRTPTAAAWFRKERTAGLLAGCSAGVLARTFSSKRLRNRTGTRRLQVLAPEGRIENSPGWTLSSRQRTKGESWECGVTGRIRPVGPVRTLRLVPFFILPIVLLLTRFLFAQTPDFHSILATSRQRMETLDFSATGHLVSVEAGGARRSYPITIKAHWFPGVLRIKAELGTAKAGSSSTPSPSAAIHSLFEIRPDGRNAIWLAQPGDKSPEPLPFDKWTDGPLGSAFSYEDFLDEQIFWPGQTLVEQTKLGARDCVVVKSTPGSSDRTHYAEVKTWFDRTIAFPVYVEKTAKQTGAVKEFTSYGIRREGGLWSAHQIELKTRGQAGSTLLIFDRGTPKANLTLNDFSPAQLTRF